MIFEYFRKRREANAAKIREEEERILKSIHKQREAARSIVKSHNRSRSTYDDSYYSPTSYSSYDSSSYDSGSCSDSSSSCDSGGGGGCD